MPAVHVFNTLCRQFNVPPTVQDIRANQVNLDETKDEDEQRAPEDVTEKMDPVALLVWDLCRRRRTVTEGCESHSERRRYRGQWRHMGGPHRNRHQQGLWQIYIIAMPTDPGDDQVRLQRMQERAPQKYQLWLDARATEQAEWSGRNGGAPTIVN
ncbi:hypothetical protein EV401DRAFT_599138 [Pisolithus croceorrhizus]|nr:hypothetical protein EV401DRAFT_599138 [Pisolithus croceorrhizus]